MKKSKPIFTFMANTKIYKKICELLEEGTQGVLATIIKSRGSTPAGNLSKMIILDNGAKIIGTVGGGCVEAEIITTSRKVFTTQKPIRASYNLTEDDIEGGLICGGTIDVFIEPLHTKMLPVFREVIENSLQGENSVLGTVLKDNIVEDKFLINRSVSKLPGIISAETVENIRAGVLETKRSEIIEKAGVEILFEPITGLTPLIIFGGGHVSKFVAEFAQKCDFSVTIIDDRIKYASKKRFPFVDNVICEDFKKVFSKVSITDKTFIVIVTRGHAYDEQILEDAVKTDASYIGMIGSRRKIGNTYKNLKERGIATEKLRNVFAPMGLDIGAESAEAIGISIVSELIKVRQDNNGRSVNHLKNNMNTFFEKFG